MDFVVERGNASREGAKTRSRKKAGFLRAFLFAAGISRARAPRRYGYYKNEQGERVSFTPEISGLSSYRKVSDVTCRLAVCLYVIAGLGTRQVSKWMKLLFQVDVSKSSIDRWVREVADSLPSEDEIIILALQTTIFQHIAQ